MHAFYSSSYWLTIKVHTLKQTCNSGMDGSNEHLEAHYAGLDPVSWIRQPKANPLMANISLK